jgi:hypothetical protein
VSCTLWTDVHCTAVPLHMWNVYLLCSAAGWPRSEARRHAAVKGVESSTRCQAEGKRTTAAAAAETAGAGGHRGGHFGHMGRTDAAAKRRYIAINNYAVVVLRDHAIWTDQDWTH